MKTLSFYKQLNLNTEDEVFQYFTRTLRSTITLWSYFVDWNKVFSNSAQLEIGLNILNYLIGKEDFDTEFKILLKQQPSVIPLLPALAVRDGRNNTKFEILIDYKQKTLDYRHFDFRKSNPSDADIEDYLDFVKETGINQLFDGDKVKNLVDYIVGVEAGLDSNGRKNRGGHAMEAIVESFIKTVCEEQGYEYIREANAAAIQARFGLIVPVDKSSRRYDFVINTPRELYLVETNFYGGGGSKLKSTAGEYRDLHSRLAGKYKFVWITDGAGWYSALNPLRETFNQNEFVLNLNLVEKGALEYILAGEK